MKQKDLRIGNYIQHGNYVAIVGPAFFTSWDNYDFEKDGIFKPEIQPIPLTEEWLVKFGFEDIYGAFISTKWMWNFQIEKHESFKDGWIFFIEEEGIVAPPSIKIKYVHQLQNLYFALTGEEIELYYGKN